MLEPMPSYCSNLTWPARVHARIDGLAGVQTAVDMTIHAHECAVCIPENRHAGHLPLHTRPAGRARISLLSQVTSSWPPIELPYWNSKKGL